VSSSRATGTVGVVGLGAIGSGVAAAVARSSFALAVCDVRPEATQKFSSHARVCAGASELGGACDIVLVAVVDDDQLRDVLCGPAGALASMARGSTVIVLSTVSVPTVLEVAKAASAHGVEVLDCGVTGGPSAAADGALVSMVGGTADAVARVTPVLDTFSSLVVHMGPLGAGLKAKLARNRDTYALFGTARFTRHIEAAYTTMWQRYQNGEPPQAFAVAPID